MADQVRAEERQSVKELLAVIDRALDGGYVATIDDVEAIERATLLLAPPVTLTTVHFSGGPWAGRTFDTQNVTSPVFAVGHEVGNHYWLDSKSDPPTYFWQGTP